MSYLKVIRNKPYMKFGIELGKSPVEEIYLLEKLGYPLLVWPESIFYRDGSYFVDCRGPVGFNEKAPYSLCTTTCSLQWLNSAIRKQLTKEEFLTLCPLEEIK